MLPSCYVVVTLVDGVAVSGLSQSRSLFVAVLGAVSNDWRDPAQVLTSEVLLPMQGKTTTSLRGSATRSRHRPAGAFRGQRHRGHRRARWGLSTAAFLAGVCCLALSAFLGLTEGGHATTAAPAAQGLWSETMTPAALLSDTKALAVPSRPDFNGVELGVRLQTRVAGRVEGVLFYKGALNTGVHTGTLWSASGKPLATGTFTGETSTGWQTLRFSTAVPVAAGARLVVSYHTASGHYAATSGYFRHHVVLTASLRAPANVNGVYAYGSGFPTHTYHSSNYWVDVLFQPSPAASPPTPASLPSTVTPSSPPTPASLPSTTPATVTPSSPATPTPTTTLGSPTPTPTASPSPTSAQASGTDCAQDPSSCGFPDSTNTGVPSGTTLINVPAQETSGPGWSWNGQGDVVVTGQGAVIDGLNVDGDIEVEANDVTIERTKITQTGDWWAIGLYHADNTTIEDTTITSTTDSGPDRLEVGIKDVYGDTSGTQILRTNISDADTAIQIANGVIEDNYLHDFGYKSGDHVNGISVGGGDLTSMLIQHNTILNQVGQTDAIALFQDFGDEANKTINDNLLAGGDYALYGGGPNGSCSTYTDSSGCFGPSDHIVITNNRFSTIFSPNCGTYGPVAAFNQLGAGNVWSGNVWDDSNALVPEPQ